MPDRYRHQPQELLFQAFRLAAPMPVCERHLRAILQGLEQAKDVEQGVEEALGCPSLMGGARVPCRITMFQLGATREP